MKSAIYYGKENVKIVDLQIPKVGDNDVLIRNIYSSICGTDTAVFFHGPGTGHKIEVGGEFGHETVSEVVKVGKNVLDFRLGDIVYPYPRFAKGDTSKAGVIGGFSEYILIPDAVLGHSLYLVPPEIDTKTASLTEPFTVGCRSARRAVPKKGEKAVVFGCGTIGIAAAFSLRYFGCEEVLICDFSDFRLNIAKKFGFSVCRLSNENFAVKASEVFGTSSGLGGKTVPDADIFIDAAGSDMILDTFVEYGKIGSRIVLVAVNNTKRPLDLLHFTYAQKSLIGSGGYMPEDVADVFEIMKSRSDIGEIITHTFELEKITEALRTAADSKNAFNVAIDFGGRTTGDFDNL